MTWKHPVELVRCTVLADDTSASVPLRSWSSVARKQGIAIGSWVPACMARCQDKFDADGYLT